MLVAYLGMALWSSHDESDESGGEPMDRNYTITDFAEKAVDEAERDCRDFLDNLPVGGDVMDGTELGHNFWLTRNGHGTGFWDRGLGDIGNELSNLAKSYGTSDAYIGDDGKVYLS
jgi:hypothetical protein